METTQNWTGIMVCYYYYFFTKYKLTANKMAKTVWMFLMFKRHGGLRIRTIFRSSMTFVSTKKRALTLAPLYWFFGRKFKMFVCCYVFNILKQKINKEALVIVVWTKQSVTFEKRVAWKIHLVCDGLDFYTWWASSSHNFHSTQDTLH